MPELLTHAIAGGSSAGLSTAIIWFTIRGPIWRERLWTRAAEQHVTRTQRRRRAHIERGTVSRRTTRALHNDFDPACDHWFGDRRPETNDTTNRDFGGTTTALTELRCIVCRPYPDDEDRTLTDPDTTFTHLPAPQ